MTDPTFTDAEFERFLKDISVAFMRPEFTLWRRRLLLPFSMVTADGPVTLHTDADVARNFALYLKACEAMGLNLVHREPMGIEQCPDGTVLATYRTHLMHNATRLADPYTSTALLHPCPDGWRMSAILNARGHHTWTGRPPTNSGE
ncbi:hypothetical protein [Maliponia aquimaris]|uniref:DUF4440 domain-containing protein n=1 Tax=Maliponia aquimaris TaxID=1673631 RepID=A0A238KTP3_9RHOB|nr:hypothetical protein [Maliponia aquimaris]SMX46169.1 hypothetical protein MAA8898_03347 [Maliponia aquimaris]